ncbi:MAG: single-stranded DNA-binding protein [Desulfohalobiaceae bacterium]
MAGSFNKVILVGRLGQDPKLAYTASGSPVVNFSMATDESFTDQQGTRQERTEWHRIVVFGRQAEMCSNYLAKGRLVLVEGSLQTRQWEDQQGQKRYTTEVKALRVNFMDSKGSGAGVAAAPQDQGRKGSRQQPEEDNEDLGPAFPSEASAMDDVPF